MAANKYETINRYKRGRALADHCRAWGIDALNHDPDKEQLKTAGRVMGWDSPPSIATWMLALYLLEEGR